MLTTVGYLVQVIAILVFTWNLIVQSIGARESRPVTTHGMPGPSNGRPNHLPSPGTSTLFPTVKSRRPLWDAKHPEDPDYEYE